MINLNELFNKEIGVKMNWNTNEKQNESGSKIENQNGIEDRNRKSKIGRGIEDRNGIENRRSEWNRKSKAAIKNRNRNYKKTEGL